MLITVTICTWNRCQSLQRTLSKMLELIIPKEIDWELLVVNNNCTDDTDKIIESFRGRLPIARLFEPRQGKSYALNLAVKKANGDFLVFTDDDVLVDQNWLLEYYKAFQLRPEAAIFGGPVYLQFEGQISNLFRRILPSVQSVYAFRDLGEKPVQITAKTVPYGANLAIRTAEHQNYSYDPQLGPNGSSFLKSEETALLINMLRDGLTGYWVPTAQVMHIIPAERQTIQYIQGVMFSWGKYLSLYPSKTEQPVAMLFGRPRWLWGHVLKTNIRYFIHRILKPPEVWIRDLSHAATSLGLLYYYQKGRNGMDSCQK